MPSYQAPPDDLPGNDCPSRSNREGDDQKGRNDIGELQSKRLGWIEELRQEQGDEEQALRIGYGDHQSLDEQIGPGCRRCFNYGSLLCASPLQDPQIEQIGGTDPTQSYEGFCHAAERRADTHRGNGQLDGDSR